MATFTKLLRRENVTSEQVVITLGKYANRGHPINPDVVILLADRTKCTNEQILRCVELAQQATDYHVSVKDNKTAEQYGRIVNQLQARLPKEIIKVLEPGSDDTANQ